VGRPIGSKHPDYARKRAALAEAALPRLLADAGETSLNELAAAIGVSVPTLKHYFGDRAGLVAAAWRRLAELARPHLRDAETPSADDLETSLRDFLRALLAAWRAFGVGRVFSVGLAAGLHDAAVGPAYLDGVLEPTLQALERRLRRHAERGQLRVRADDGDGLRAAALVLLSPVVLALIHQDALGGASCRALDVEAFVDFHLAGFIRAHGRDGGAPRRAR
jgi:AcrR family transcriptional regulator